MIVYPYLGKNNRVKNGTKLSIYTSTIMLIYCILYMVLSLGTTTLYLYSYGITELIYVDVYSTATIILDWLIITLQML